jgi:hypothetical protein
VSTRDAGREVSEETARTLSDLRPRFRCAVVVFVDVRGVDQGDANHAAERVVRHSVGGERGELPALYQVPGTQGDRFRGADVSARVVNVMDLGTAARNGYLTQPAASNASWRQLGLDEEDGDSF